MDETAKEARRKYRREWYQTHKEQAKLYQERYWRKKYLGCQKTDGQSGESPQAACP